MLHAHPQNPHTTALPMQQDRFYADSTQPMSHRQIVQRIRDLNADIAFWRDTPKLASYSRRFDDRKIAACEAEIARLDAMLEDAP